MKNQFFPLRNKKSMYEKIEYEQKLAWKKKDNKMIN